VLEFFTVKKHTILWHHIKGVLFAGQCPVNAVIQRPVLEKLADFLSSCTPISFSRKCLLYGVYFANVMKTIYNLTRLRKNCTLHFQQQQQHNIKELKETAMLGTAHYFGK
jgi:hypothetical protein